ncbi:MAG: DUF47 domain-containing protein [Candidatus Methanomethylophilaceae archaeon]|jgi:uncharacterized protein Yka (UPF0111/DUF47 family)
MGNSKDLLDWFGNKKAGSVENGARDHALTVMDAVIELKMAIGAMGEENEAEAMKCVDRLVMSERDADRLEDRLSTEIAGSGLSAQDRENLLNFVRALDHVANWSKESSIHLQVAKETKARIPEDIWLFIFKTASELENEMKMLIGAMDAFHSRDSEEAVRGIESVKDQERVIDEMNFEGIKRIHLSDMDVRGIILSKDILHGIEEASDTVKACADMISIFIAARRK